VEALQWPGGVARPEFMTREMITTMGETLNRNRDATPLELWASLFAGDCAVLFNSHHDLVKGFNQ
jgi:hypothetical protein